MLFSEEIKEIFLDEKVEDLLSAAAANFRPPRNRRSQNFYFAPNIPKKKIENVLSERRHGAEGLLKEGDVWAVVDERTILGSPKNGVMVTNFGIFWKSIEYADSQAIPWRIGDSRITEFVMSKGLLVAELGAIIDDELFYPMGSVGVNFEVEFMCILLNSLIEIANEQNMDASGGTL
jgi:hypothetical protein